MPSTQAVAAFKHATHPGSSIQLILRTSNLFLVKVYSSVWFLLDLW